MYVQDFYGKACIASHGQTFADAKAGKRPHGSYLFTKDETGSGQLQFGINPEAATSPNCVFAEVVGNMVDRNISSNSDFARVMSMGAGGNPHTDIPLISGTPSISLPTEQVQVGAKEAATNAAAMMQQAPFTDAVAATVSSVRELCGQRIPAAQWRQWMGEMYGTNLPKLPTKVSGGSSCAL